MAKTLVPVKDGPARPAPYPRSLAWAIRTNEFVAGGWPEPTHGEAKRLKSAAAKAIDDEQRCAAPAHWTFIRGQLARLALHFATPDMPVMAQEKLFGDYMSLLSNYAADEWVDATEAAILELDFFPKVVELKRLLDRVHDERARRLHRLGRILTIARQKPASETAPVRQPPSPYELAQIHASVGKAVATLRKGMSDADRKAADAKLRKLGRADLLGSDRAAMEGDDEARRGPGAGDADRDR